MLVRGYSGSDAPDREHRQRLEREAEREAEELCAVGKLGAREATPLLLPTPSLRAPAGEEYEAGYAFFCTFFGTHGFSSGYARAAGKAEPATCRHYADCGWETDCSYSRYDRDIVRK